MRLTTIIIIISRTAKKLTTFLTIHMHKDKITIGDHTLPSLTIVRTRTTEEKIQRGAILGIVTITKNSTMTTEMVIPDTKGEEERLYRLKGILVATKMIEMLHKEWLEGAEVVLEVNKVLDLLTICLSMLLYLVDIEKVAILKINDSSATLPLTKNTVSSRNNARLNRLRKLI